MINIDTRILAQVTPDQLYLLCHIVNFMNENKMCFPSNKKLIEQSGFSESKILRVKNDLVTRNIISVKKRFRPDGSQTSNLYRIETDLIGVFVTGKNMSNLEPHPFTDEDGGTFSDEGGTPSNMNTLEVLANRSINKKEVLSSCDFEKSPPFEPEIKNPFSRQSFHDSLSYEQKIKERKSVAEQKERKSPDRETSETYLCFTAFASTYERLAGVTYPSDKNNYIMTAKDGANCKKLVTWLKKVSASEQAADEMVTMFTTAAWQISDKWLKANFTISNIYSQANNIYTKFMYSNPAAQEKRRQEEIDRLVNEFEG
jgi:hypothetical protein